MADLPWLEAIQKVLREAGKPMHYAEIAKAIADRGYRNKLGATPAITVSSYLSGSVNREDPQSQFLKIATGIYGLRENVTAPAPANPEVTAEEAVTEGGLIQAFGMYWSRNRIAWADSQPKLLGQQQIGSTPVDFSRQKGLYLLHDGRSTIYVGRVVDQSLALRLKQHTLDRLNGRWDRFSWFGVLPVDEAGTVSSQISVKYTLDMLIITMEALLIEGLEPPQNRKRGDELGALEYIQGDDPSLIKKQKENLLDELRAKI